MSRRHVARLSGPEPGRIDVTPAAGGGECGERVPLSQMWRIVEVLR